MSDKEKTQAVAGTPGLNREWSSRLHAFVYVVRFTDAHGKRHYERAGTGLAEARALLFQRRQEVEAGEYVPPGAVDPRQGPTFAEFAERFEKEYASQRRSSHYTNRLKPLKAFFGERLLKDIRRGELDVYAAHRARQVGPSTLRKDLIAVGTMFKVAVRWNVLEASPAVDLQKPPEPDHKTRYLSADEWAGLRDAAPPWLRPILAVAVGTGARLKEVVSLTWGDYDKAAGQLYIGGVDSKTGRGRTVPVSEFVRQVLEGVPRRLRSPFIFTDSASEPHTSNEARLRVGRACKALMVAVGIDDATFHTLRHTCASWLVQNGAPLLEVQKLLGHSTPVVTQRYAHLSPEHLRGTIAKLDAVLATKSASSSETPAPEAASSRHH